MTIIVDASIALKWVLTEDGTDRALDLLANEQLAAPGLFWIECANVLWAKARRGQISPADARAALAAIDSAPVSALATRPLAQAAQAMALELDQTAYACRSKADAPEIDGVVYVESEREIAEGEILRVHITSAEGHELTGRPSA